MPVFMVAQLMQRMQSLSLPGPAIMSNLRVVSHWGDGLVPLSYPTFSAAAPYFDGSNVTEFLEVYEDMYADYRIFAK